MSRAVPLSRRSSVALGLTSAIGVVAFGWPLLAAPGSAAVAHANDAPLVVALLLPLLLVVVLAELSEQRMDAKAVALLGVLASVGTAARTLGAGVAGFEPVWLVIILGGRVFGRGFGFVLGAVTLLASALATGGVGPWLPFQMIGAGWVGFAAGCLPAGVRGRREIAMLVGYSAVAAFGYGVLLNLWFWPWATGLASTVSYLPGAPLAENLGRWLVFSAATSLGWDAGRAITVGVLITVTGTPVLRSLRRASRRAAFDVPATFGPVTTKVGS